MKKCFIIITLFILCSSCRSGLDLGDSFSFDKVKSYKIKDFDIYVYNICEKIGKEVNNDRFYNCQDNFYDLAMKDSIRKVEEVYLLKHKKSNLILYLTSFSHKYIVKNSGFLNDRKCYENKIVLNQIEYVYIGTIDDSAKTIHFPSYNKKEDIILELNNNLFPRKIALCNAYIATSDNNYDISESIDLNKVFKDSIVYKKNNNFLFDYYHSNEVSESKIKKQVSEIKIVSTKGKVDMIFSFKNFRKQYKISNKRIKYRPNFVLIEE